MTEPAPSLSGAERRDDTLTALAVALLATAVGLSTFYSRAEGDLDWSNYTLGLLATLGLLGVAGALVLALSALGYVAVRAAPFVVSAILGLALLYAKVVDDLFGVVDLEDGDNGVMLGAFVLLVFTVVVTAAGWALPTRVLSGVLAGAVSVIGFAVLLAFVGIFAAFASFASDPFAESGRDTTFDNDVKVVLALALLLVLAWTALAHLTGHVAFRLLAVVMAVAVVPATTVVLAVAHPTWWAVAVGVPGGLLLLAVLGLRLRGGRGPGGQGVPPTSGPGFLPPPPPPLMPRPSSPPPGR